MATIRSSHAYKVFSDMPTQSRGHGPLPNGTFAAQLSLRTWVVLRTATRAEVCLAERDDQQATVAARGRTINYNGGWHSPNVEVGGGLDLPTVSQETSTMRILLISIVLASFGVTSVAA
ncbi:MAG TPA: hypothetical protein VHE81_21365, partial [Lacipirellulaceae bacterium]|nr:hypothetical protein [Lacipirellulaceae bacterium]